eukprot:m.525044 g.525044  ORF g.525044 m.525044 type:complete len:1115 (+) comp57539_c0_seq1:615-3959(+)
MGNLTVCSFLLLFVSVACCHSFSAHLISASLPSTSLAKAMQSSDAFHGMGVPLKSTDGYASVAYHEVVQPMFSSFLGHDENMHIMDDDIGPPSLALLANQQVPTPPLHRLAATPPDLNSSKEPSSTYSANSDAVSRSARNSLSSARQSSSALATVPSARTTAAPKERQTKRKSGDDMPQPSSKRKPAKPMESDDDEPEEDEDEEEAFDDPDQRASQFQAPAQFMCAIFISSIDARNCRFSVKNDAIEKNQEIGVVQRSGYIEMRARYSQARRSEEAFGSFHLAFLPASKIIYPVMRSSYYTEPGASEDPPTLSLDNFNPASLVRLEVTVRLFQAFRGSFPIRVVKFSENEMYHPLYVSRWHNSTLLQSTTATQKYRGMSAMQDSDGQYVTYVVHDLDVLKRITTEQGICFPLPIPEHIERLNDVGMLRMQVVMKPYFDRSCMTPPGVAHVQHEYSSWIRIKVVQQLSGTKRMFHQMLRDGSRQDWAYPPRPVFLNPDKSTETVIRYALGEQIVLGSNAMTFLRDFAREMARKIQGTQGHTENAIHLAIKDANISMLRFLVQDNLGLIHVKNDQGNTPLHQAVKVNDLNIVRFLYEAGSELDCTNLAGFTPQQLAHTLGHTAISDFLRSAADRERKWELGTLHRASSAGSLFASFRLLQSKAISLTEKNYDGFTPLFLAVHNNKPLSVALLLTHARARRIDAKELGLITDDSTLLHFAAERGYVVTASFIILFQPALVTAVDKLGRTPLHLAATNGMVLLTSLLIASASDLQLQDSSGRTPIDLAASRHHPGTWLLLFKAASQRLSIPALDTMPQRVEAATLTEAARLGDVVLVRQLMRRGQQPNAPSENGDTPIIIACKHANLLVLDELLMSHQELCKAGMVGEDDKDINVAGAQGLTPLHIAAQDSNLIGCLLVLLTTTLVNVNILSGAGRTPLHDAVERGHLLPAALLLVAGAQVNIRDANGHTPDDLARANGHVIVSSMLRTSDAKLDEVRTLLLSPPPPISGPSATQCFASNLFLHMDLVVHNPSEFDWCFLMNVLTRIWDCTKTARKLFNDARQVDPSHSIISSSSRANITSLDRLATARRISATTARISSSSQKNTSPLGSQVTSPHL